MDRRGPPLGLGPAIGASGPVLEADGDQEQSCGQPDELRHPPYETSAEAGGAYTQQKGVLRALTEAIEEVAADLLEQAQQELLRTVVGRSLHDHMEMARCPDAFEPALAGLSQQRRLSHSPGAAEGDGPAVQLVELVAQRLLGTARHPETGVVGVQQPSVMPRDQKAVVLRAQEVGDLATHVRYEPTAQPEITPVGQMRICLDSPTAPPEIPERRPQLTCEVVPADRLMEIHERAEYYPQEQGHVAPPRHPHRHGQHGAQERGKEDHGQEGP